MTDSIAMTGATGFVGCHVLKALLDHGFKVRVLCRNPQAVPDLEGLEVCPGHLESESDLLSLVEGASAILHCAGIVHGNDASAFHRVNAIGTENLVEAARKAEVGHFLLVSSLAAREPSLSPYAASKRAGEDVLRALNEDGAELDWEIVRPPAVYGPGDRATLGFFRMWQKGIAITPNNPAARFAMIYVEDLARALAGRIGEGLESGQIWDIHDGQPGGYGWSDLITAAERCFGRSIRPIGVPKAVLKAVAGLDAARAKVVGGEVRLSPGKIEELYHPDWTCDSNLLDVVTNRSPAIGLEEGFEKTVAWYKAHGWLT